MATANEALFDASVRHQIYLQRYSGTVVNKFIALLNRSDTDLVESIQRRLASIEGKGFDGGPQVTKRLQALLVEIRDLNAAAYSVAGKGLLDELRTFAEYETEWQTSTLDKVLPEGVSVTAPSPRTVTAAALARPFQGRLLKEWLGGLEGAKAGRVRDAIRLGMVEGETIDQIVRRIRGTRALGYADGLMEIDRRGAAALVRTAVNHVGSVARDQVAADNSDILKGERWTATLDGRTSAICRGRDGTIYPVGKGPKPPAHIGCRSLRVAILSDEFADLRLDGQRASVNGPVRGDETYQTWLKRQPASFQDDVLGADKAALFRTGGLTLDKFVDANGKEFTLDQLKAIQPAAYAKAGLSNPIRPPRGTPQDAIAQFLASPQAQQQMLQEVAGASFRKTMETVRAVKTAERWSSTDESLAAVRIYTGPNYEKINAEARRGDLGALKARQFTALTGSALPGMKPYSGPIWRSPTKTPTNADNWWSKAVIGEELEIGKSLQSFSAVPGEAAKFSERADVLFQIESARVGASVSKISFYPKEAEVLLPSGLRYRVVGKGVKSVDVPGFGTRIYRVIRLEIVNVEN